MLGLSTRPRRSAKPAQAWSLKVPVADYCPWCRVRLEDVSRLQTHLKLLHPQAAEYNALRRRSGA